MAHLEARDPDLYRAVKWLEWRETDESMALFRLTSPAWEARSRNEGERLKRMHARFRPPGAEPTARAVYSRFLRATAFLESTARCVLSRLLSTFTVVVLWRRLPAL